MDEAELSMLVLGTPQNFLWYTDGADNRVDYASQVGVASVVITREGEYVVTNNIEGQRFREELTPDIEVVEYPWFESDRPILERLAAGPAGADSYRIGLRDIAPQIAPLRWVLDEDALRRYPLVGALAAEAMEEACASVLPGMSEEEASAYLMAACRRRGLFASVALAAADDRITRYRHPVSHGQSIRARVMLVLCAEGGGLYANLTRFVDFEEPGADIVRRREACRLILDGLRSATTPGRTMGELFEVAQGLYQDAGFPEEWRLHHQGGLTGYASREVVASPDSGVRVELNQAFAWNPSVAGTKSEETFVVTDHGPRSIAGGD
jgi:Xaa-Pro aminopeptidase